MTAQPTASPPVTAEQPAAPAQARRSRWVLLTLLIVAVVAALLWAGHWWLVGRFIESTDDAFLQADSMTVAPKVSGYIAEVMVADNQAVTAGQPLARLDDRKYHAAFDEAQATIAARQADVAKAEADLVQQDASIAQSRADMQGAQADAGHAKAQVQRYAPLARSGAETEERLADLQNDMARASTSLAARQAALRASQTRIGTLQAQLLQARAQLAVAQASATQAGLDLEDTTVRSPIDGRVGDRSVRVGQFTQPGTRLLTVVPVQALYLTANFKETQIGGMRPGQAVTVHVDALSGRDLAGHVDSITPGTGSQFALLPSSNATGNFTKIVQRVPVRIQVDIPDDVRQVLVPGLSVTVDVDVRSQAHDRG